MPAREPDGTRLLRRRSDGFGAGWFDNDDSCREAKCTWLAARRKSWARLIRCVYEVDPLLCRCGKRMRIVGFITRAPVIRLPLSARRQTCAWGSG